MGVLPRIVVYNKLFLHVGISVCAVLLIGGLFVATQSVVSHAAMYGDIQGYGGGYNWRHVAGSIDTPVPTNVPAGTHKVYMVYFSNGFGPFTAGTGIYIYRNSGGPITTCHMMLYKSDNAAFQSFQLDCSPVPSGTVSIKLEQTADNGASWKGTSGGNINTQTWTVNPDPNPPMYGAAAGGSTDIKDIYSFITNLQVKTWGGNTYSFLNSPANAPGTYKCYVDTGYKYDNQNHNTFISGPPAVTVDDCTAGLESLGYSPHGEWD
jgi:hypothetical protein